MTTSYYAILMSLALILLGCTTNKKTKEPHQITYLYNYSEHPHYSLMAKQTGYDTTTWNNEKISLFGVTLEMSAKQDSLPGIYLMSCSWGSRNAITNHVSFFAGEHDCDLNMLFPVGIIRNEILELKTIVAAKSIDFEEHNKLRIAIIAIDTTQIPLIKLIDSNYGDQFQREYDSLKLLPEHYVWSNEFILKEMETKINHWGSYTKKHLMIDKSSVSSLDTTLYD